MDNKAQLLNFLENYGGELMSFALSLLGNKAEAEDACQEMVVQMLKHWESFEGDRNLKSWAFTILYRKCLDQLKKRKRFLNFFNRAAVNYKTSLDDPAEDQLQKLIGGELIKTLRPSERTCLILWAREGYSAEEIASIVGCAPGTVRVHLYQARKKLKKLMGRENEKKA